MKVELHIDPSLKRPRVVIYAPVNTPELQDLARRLVARGIKTGEDLAEQAVDDLTDVEGLDEKKAGEIIMAARNEYWFKDSGSETKAEQGSADGSKAE